MSFLNKLPGRMKLVLVLSIIIVFSLPAVLMAQGANADQECVPKYRTYLDEVGPKFLQEIEAHFNNTGSTTTLIPSALDKFNAYKRLINAKRLIIESEVVPKDQALTQAEAISIFQKCDNEMRDHVNIMKQVLDDHIRRNTEAKRTFIFLQEYKRINEKLDGLNRELGEMRGNFKVLDTKVENFVPNCVK